MAFVNGASAKRMSKWGHCIHLYLRQRAASHSAMQCRDGREARGDMRSALIDDEMACGATALIFWRRRKRKENHV